MFGVWVVKFVEKRNAPVRMWKIEMAIKTADPETIRGLFDSKGIPTNFNNVGRWTMFNCYCDTRKQTSFVKHYALEHGGKISAYESKNL